MKTRILGKSGYVVSEIGLGCWQLGNDFGPVEEQQAAAILDTAEDQQICFWDTADVYGAGLSERRIGQWLASLGPNDKRPLVATKVGRDAALYPDGYTKARVRTNLLGSIDRLGVEALDLVQLHCVPTEILMAGDMLDWMEDFQQEGLIKAFGASVEKIDEALFCVEHPKLTSLQILFNLFRQDATEVLLPKAAEKEVGVIVRLPLASGLLSGKMTKDQQFAAGDHRNYNRDGAAFHVGETFNGIPFEKGVELVQELNSFVPQDMTLLQMALRWILDQPQVSTVIAGASKAYQVESNAAASALPPLSDVLHQQLWAFYYDKVRDQIRGGF